MFFRKKEKMDELKKTDQEHVEELNDDQLEGVAGGGFPGRPIKDSDQLSHESVVDDAYGQFQPMPEMRD